jgi:dTDP-4-amino-4,6-dideoxygalactose transaminase
MGMGKGDFPLAEEISRSVLSLPIYPGLPFVHQEYIASVIHGFFKNR